MSRSEATIRAEKIIAEARRQELSSLSLRNLGLRDLPDSISNLTNVLHIDLTGNELTFLSDSLLNLSNLLHLNLSVNRFQTLPERLGDLTKLETLNLSYNQLATLPSSLGQLQNLKKLDVSLNEIRTLPDSIGNLANLIYFDASLNFITSITRTLGNLTNLNTLILQSNQIEDIPDTLFSLSHLRSLDIGNNRLLLLHDLFQYINKLKILILRNNRLSDIPASIADLTSLEELNLDGNPLNLEIAAAYEQGILAVKTYLRAKKVGRQIILNEAKLILVGEGEVGKSSLLGALRDDPWEEGKPTTHGIEIKPVSLTHADNVAKLTLNGWDFGGQRVYRPTHQLFFSAPAVYLVVWKPREGPQQGFVKEWIKLIKHRAPEAKILVVATHGGPGGRQPDIDRQDLIDTFGQDTVLGFFHVESKPDKKGKRRGIDDLKQAIAVVASSLPEVGRSVPERWQTVRQLLAESSQPYLPLSEVINLCRQHQMDETESKLFISIAHRLGQLIHYEHDPALHDMVVLKPDWLATAISFVLDDEQSRKNHGLVSYSHLCQLWSDNSRSVEFRYPKVVHPIFLRLMERFDLSYKVADIAPQAASDPISLIAQLVADNRPLSIPAWENAVNPGDRLQQQICRIVDDKNNAASAEGLFYQLIVRLHKYSLGRLNYQESVHWQRGLVLDADYNGRALLEHIGDDVRITVRAAYPERLLTMLTEEIKYLVENFWKGLRCNVMVPCIEPCGLHEPGFGLFEVEKLITSKQKGRTDYPCSVCSEWQTIDALLQNAPVSRGISPVWGIYDPSTQEDIRRLVSQLASQHGEVLDRFDQLDARQRELLSKADAVYSNLLRVLTDEAKEGPRLFSLVPVNRRLNPRNWTSAKFRLTLWCEHSRLPLPVLPGAKSKDGVYEFEVKREWFRKATPFLKFMTGTLSLVLPVAASGLKLSLDDNAFKAIEEQLDFGKDIIDGSLDAGSQVGSWLGSGKDDLSLQHGESIRADGAVLREFQIMLKELDPTSTYGGLVRVLNKRQEFLWVHPQFAGEY